MKKVLEKPKKTDGNMINFRADDDVMRLLEAAIHATGANKTELIIRCIKANMPKVVDELDALRKEGMSKFRFGSGNPDSGSGHQKVKSN